MAQEMRSPGLNNCKESGVLKLLPISKSSSLNVPAFPEVQGAGVLRTFTTEAINLESLFNGIREILMVDFLPTMTLLFELLYERC